MEKFQSAFTAAQIEAAIGANAAGTIATITTSGDWTVPTGVTLLKDVWIIAGGGGGSGNQGGGGGAGGLKHLTNIAVTPSDSLIAVIGAGGAGASMNGANGGNSTLTIGSELFIAYGGGSGGCYNATHRAMDGGCGGGGVSDGLPGYGSQGYWGGRNPNAGYDAGGGGGLSEGGIAATNTVISGNGGDGINLSAIVGASIGDSGWFGGGGAGGNFISSSQVSVMPLGGRGGGGNGGYTSSVNGENGLANSGGGGGGGGYTDSPGNGGNGGSGIIIIRY